MRDRKQRIFTVALGAVALAFLVTAIETVIQSLGSSPNRGPTQQVRHPSDNSMTTHVNQQSLATHQKQQPFIIPDNLPFQEKGARKADNQLLDHSILKALVGENKIVMQRVEAVDPKSGLPISHVVQYLTSEDRSTHLKGLFVTLESLSYISKEPHAEEIKRLEGRFLFSNKQAPGKRVTIHFTPEKTGPSPSTSSRTRVLLWYQDLF